MSEIPAAHQRVLDAAARKGVTLDIVTFPDSTHTAADAAAALGVELGQIVKSLVFVAPDDAGELTPYLALTSGANRVDIGRLAAVVGESGMRRASAREANELTGFTIGGIPPIGHLRPIRVVMDPDLGRYQVVWAAAGTPTSVFAVPPGTLRQLANATVAPIAETPPAEQAPVAVMDPDAQGASGTIVPGAGSSPAGATTGA
ncbi:MAG TPA: YbaK/EbsC family protein [Candidatus Sulfotelmatobacter sp.]|nr:YbaK/EbsC family protein [Candidatus Sulfotelmatobacter sp.]